MIRNALRMATLLALVAVTALWPRGLHCAGPSLTFIVNRDNPVTSITVQELTEYYEKSKRNWPDGTLVRFVDHDQNSPERRIFIESVLGKSTSDIDLYWVQQKVRTGTSMPIQVTSDALVRQFVRSFKGAIGYISAAAPWSDHEVKTIRIQGAEKE